jgi:adenylate cyclase, class 2
MADGGVSTETEVKIRVTDPDKVVQRLAAAGFTVSKPRVFEANTVFDEPGRALKTRGCLLRLREVEAKAVLTFKGPAERGKHKSREELETGFGDPSVGAKILERLGFQRAFRYEKYRTEFHRPGQDGVVTLDQTPIGWFVELEGSPEWIDRTALQLGWSEAEYITDSYGSLYLQHCKQNDLEPTDMVFQ